MMKPLVVKMMHKPLEFICRKCGKVYSKRDSWIWHEHNTHNYFGELTCKICNRKFKKDGYREFHERWHNPEFKEKMCELVRGENNPMWGKKRPDFAEMARNQDKRGSKNPNWKGDKVGYCGVHRWMGKILSKPDRCLKCGRTDIKVELSNKDQKYTRNPKDWEWSCHSCHSYNDYKLGLRKGLAPISERTRLNLIKKRSEPNFYKNHYARYKELDKAYRLRNVNKISERRKRYYYNNIEEISERNLKWRMRNRERLQIEGRAYYWRKKLGLI